jgi:biopolymer transport protein TolR
MAMTPTKSSTKMVMSEINVTPFVDVMLVLLVIFMVTAPMMQQGLDVNLPKTSATGISVNETPFIIMISANGVVKLADVEIPVSSIREKLSAIFKNKKNKQVYIQADRKVDYGRVAEIMGEVRQAGIFNISLITLPKD